MSVQEIPFENKGFYVFHFKGNKSKPVFSSEQQHILTKGELYSLCLIKKGETSFVINNERIQVAQNHLLLTNPSSRVNGSSVSKSWDCEVYLIFFTLDFSFKLDFQEDFFEVTKKSLALNDSYICYPTRIRPTFPTYSSSLFTTIGKNLAISSKIRL